MIIGVLALQGDFREHMEAIAACGHEALEVRRVSELDMCQALILPGGESTTIALLAKTYGLPSRSGPPFRAATSIALMSLAKFFARRPSMTAFLCLVVAHLEWPDMRRTPLVKKYCAYFIATYRPHQKSSGGLPNHA